jgi:hypothetical protein
MAQVDFACIKWSKLRALIDGVDRSGEMVVRILGDDRLLVADGPFGPGRVIDIRSERVDDTAPPRVVAHQDIVASLSEAAGVRASGSFWVEVEGRRIGCKSIKNLLLTALETIEKARPGALEKLSRAKKRTKRIVARDKRDLFDAQHLSEQFSEEIAGGWWVGVNNSKAEVIAWLRLAAFHAGLEWGRDISTSE